MDWVEIEDDECVFTIDKSKITCISKGDIDITYVYLTNGKHITLNYNYQTVKKMLGINTNE